MNSNVFTKLLGVFLLLLAVQMLVVEFVFHRIWEHAPKDALSLLGRDAFWSALIALVIALPVAAWLSRRISAVFAASSPLPAASPTAISPPASNPRARRHARIRRAFRRRIRLNQTAERLGRDFAELESGRAELAVMLDSMQEESSPSPPRASCAGPTLSCNASPARNSFPAAPRPLRPRPELLACVRGALERHELCVGRASLLAPGRVFEVNAAPLPAGARWSFSTTSPASSRANIPPRVRRQCQPRTAHAAYLHPGLRRNSH